jgi:hypothetical protein
MRRPSVFAVVLAALLVASVAFAKTTGTANITSLQSSGITGTADFSLIGNGTVRVHESLSGLTPGVQYSSFVYSNSATCGAGGTKALIMTFTAPNNGKININIVAPLQVSPLDAFSSVSVEQGSALLACGGIQ